jgi:PAS domain S-box-containing protein
MRKVISKVLILEDNVADLILLKDLLFDVGFTEAELLHAKDVETLDDPTLQFPTIILADLSLSNTFGLDTFCETFHRFPNVPIVVLTGLDDKAVALDCIKAGAQDYLVKGKLTPEDLSKTLLFAIERHALKRQLNDLKTDYEGIFEHNPLACFIIDKTSGKFINVNAAACTIYQYSKEEFLSLSMSDLEKKCCNNAVPVLSTQQFHYNKTGERLVVELSSSSIQYSDRSTYLVAVKNITEKIKLEEQQLITNRRLEAIFSGTNDAILLADDDGRYVQYNPAAARMIGYTDNEILRLNVNDVVVNVTPNEKASKSWNKFLLAGTQSGVVELKRKDGSIIICHYNAVANILPGLHLSILTDVTETESARREIDFKSKQIVDILESITEGFFTVDTNWTVKYWNKAVEKLLMKKREDMLGCSLWEVHKEPEVQKFRLQYERAIIEQRPIQFEEFYTPLSIWVEVSAYPSKEGLAVYLRDITERKQHTAQLLQARNNTTALINSTKDLIWSVDTNFKLISANEPFKKAIENTSGTGPKEGELILLPSLPAATITLWKEAYEKAFAGETFKFDHEYYSTDKAKIETAEISVNPIYDISGTNIIAAACYSTIISERKEKERLIREQNNKLRSSGQYLEKVLRNLKKIMDSSLDVICAIDNKGRFTQISAASINVWGYSPAELIGKTYIDYVHPEDEQSTNNITYSIKDGANVTNFENRFVHKNGHYVPMIWSSRWDDEQQTLISVGKDATAIKHAEKTKAESEQRFTSMVENSADIITVLDADLNYIFQSPSIKTSFGYQPALFTGRNAKEFIHAEDLPIISKLAQEVLVIGSFSLARFRFKHANGEWRWVEATGSSQFDNPAIKGIVINSRDITVRKQYELLIEEQNIKLKASEQNLGALSKKLERIMNSSLDVICAFDRNGCFVQVSNVSEHLWGYKPDELLGTPCLNYIDERHIDGTIKATEAIRSGVDMTNLENNFIHKQGHPVPILWSARWDEEDELMYCVAKDATALKEAQQAKAQTQTKFSALIRKGADMIAIVDATGTYSFVSPNVEQIFGYTDDQLVGINAFSLIHPADVQMVNEQLNILLETGEIKQATFRFRSAAGNWHWVEITGTNLLNDPAIQGIVINARDITERKLREEELRAAHERFELVSKATNEVIYDWDLNSGILRWNDNFGNVFGYEDITEEKDLSFWKSRVHPDDCERVLASLDKALKEVSSNLWYEEYRFIKANGEVATVYDHGYLIVDDNNRAIRLVGSMADITERKKKELERELIVKELTKSNNDLKQFSFITSHNLRAPLSNIIGLLNIIEPNSLNEENNVMFQMIEKSAKQLKQTIDDLSRILIIKNNVNIDVLSLDVQEIFTEISQPFFNSLNDIAAEISVSFGVDSVVFNKTYLESIFINLLSNAIKYRSPHRKLCIHIGSFLNNSNEVVLRFSDNGIGFNMKQYKDRLCGLYQRFHDNIEGQGIGLFIIKSQITALGGRLDIESEVNKGTSFAITFKNTNSHNKPTYLDYASRSAICSN